MSRIDYYPVRVSPTKKVWEVDHLIKSKLPIRGWDKPPVEVFGKLMYPREAKPVGLATLYPPTDKRSVRAPTAGKPGRTIERTVAMIPGYIYVAFGCWDDWSALLRFQDITGPLTLVGLRAGSEPYRLSGEDVRTLQALTARGAEGTATAIHKSLKEGESVRIADWYGEGLYAGQVGRLGKIGRAEAEVILEFLNALRPVKVPVGALEPA